MLGLKLWIQKFQFTEDKDFNLNSQQATLYQFPVKKGQGTRSNA
jgi:hypothetical protein